MIDYLERLLEEDEAAETLVGGRRVAVAIPREQDAGKSEEEAPAAGEDGGAESLEAALAGVRVLESLEDAPGLGEESEFPEEDGAAGAGAWLWQEQERSSAAGELLRAFQKTGRSVRAVRGGQGTVTVTLPETAGRAGEWDVLELDKAVQRDARRYDGGFSLY